ncbi:MAG: TetR/AcrR family transcriptional regulator [Clostridium sp.]|nr:TetR/AcrR family transcriptional regulator [Clostridium sp.]
MNRISKPPEIRKKEILNVAKVMFLEKGYEGTSMGDIANSIGVAQGLCYRYFKSKQELFNNAMDNYVNECSQEFIDIISNKDITIYEKLDSLSKIMIRLDDPEGVDLYYHRKGNEILHEQIELKIIDSIYDAVKELLIELEEKDLIEKIDNVDSMAGFIIYGVFGILKCDMNIKEKISYIEKYLTKVLSVKIG